MATLGKLYCSRSGDSGRPGVPRMNDSPLVVLGLGFVLGLRHALDVDHLAAVSTILSERRGLAAASTTGALWGLGHTTSLFAVAVAVIGLHAQVPPAARQLLEFGVAMMLIGLGLHLLRTLWRGGTVHLHVHAHDGHVHAHPHAQAPSEPADHAGAHHGFGRRKPFLVGVVHGLAGSGALMLATLATIPSSALAMTYVLTFGVGSIGGMMAMSLMIGAPVALAQRRFASSERALRACAAAGSVAVGLRLAWTIGVEAGWLL